MDALTSPQLSTEVGRIGQAEDYAEPEYGACDHVCVLPVMYAVYIYQTLPRGGTIPNPPSDQGEETPTKHYRILCSRCETHWCFWHGLPTLTSLHSGWDPATGLLYQAPPPGNSNEYDTLLDVLGVVGYEMIPIYFALGIGRVVTGLCE